MKIAPQAEENEHSTYTFFEGTEFAPMAVRAEGAAAVADRKLPETAVLDTFVSLVKWIFLYVPGTTAIHFITVGIALLFFYKEWPPAEMVAGTFGVVVVSAFMIMLGIGKLSDLKFLRVVGSIFAASAIAALLYSILIVFIPGDFFGFFAKATLPLPLLVGYLVKRDTDKERYGIATAVSRFFTQWAFV